MPIQKLEKDIRQLQKEVSEVLNKSDSRRSDSKSDPKIVSAASQARVLMEDIHLHYTREQRDKDIDKKAFLNLIRAVGFYEENLREAVRLLKSFLRQEPNNQREAVIDLENALIHLNYVEESINKIVTNADSLINTLNSRQQKTSLSVMHLPATHQHFRELAKEAEQAFHDFRNRKDVTSKIERIIAWILHYKEKEVKTSYKGKKAFFALLRSVEKYDKALEEAHNSIGVFVAGPGNKAQDAKLIRQALKSLIRAEKSIKDIVKDTKTLVLIVRKEEKEV